MAFRTQKISQMTPKGSDLEATDLIEVSTIESGSYVTRSITGQELIDAIPAPPSGITIGTTAITSGTVGRVLFEGTGNVVQESANLFWDNTNGRLGIGTSSPSTTFAIGSGGINRVNLGLQAFEMYTPSSVRTVFLGYSSTSGQLIIASGGSNDVNFLGGGFKSISTGNFAIGSTTDAGFRLDVNGTARVQNGLTLTNFTNITSGNNYFGFETFRTIFGTTANTISGQYAFNIDDGGGSSTLTSGTTGRFQLSSRFAPTSGTAVYNSFLLNATINQTGGANGITRGLYINPTLTAAADFRAIETTAGRVIFGGLPTSSAGLPTGAIWNDAGTLKIV